MKASDAFEQQIQRMYELLADSGAEVIWNLVADEQPGREVGFALRLQFEELRLYGEPVLEVAFKGNARLIALNATPPVVCAYGEPEEDSRQREVIVEAFCSLGIHFYHP